MEKETRRFRFLGEGILIVLSILLAFAIDAWWDGVQEGRLEQAYLARLERDLGVDMDRWRTQADRLLEKQAGLDAALAWIATPDMSGPARDEVMTNLVLGTRLAYGLGNVAERAAFDEMVSTGRFLLLEEELREAILGYHYWVDLQRARLTARETEYAARVYELIPREGEFEVRNDLADSERDRIARRVVEADLTGLITAERNRGQLRLEAVRNLLDRATNLLAEIQGAQPR